MNDQDRLFDAMNSEEEESNKEKKRTKKINEIVSLAVDAVGSVLEAKGMNPVLISVVLTAEDMEDGKPKEFTIGKGKGTATHPTAIRQANFLSIMAEKILTKFK